MGENQDSRGIYQIIMFNILDYVYMYWRVTPIVSHCTEAHPNTNEKNKNE